MIRVVFLLISTILFAHQSGLSFVDIKEDEIKKIAVVYKKPLQDIAANEITINYPSRCKKPIQNRQEITNGFIISRYSLWCGENGLKNSRVWVDGLISSNRGVMIEYKSEDIIKKALLRASSPFVLLEQKSSTFKLFVEYVKMGISHILSGYDHLLFVLSLLFIAKNLRVLLYGVSAFTIAHSITLASAVFSLLDVPVRFVESMIALSIVFLAREIVITQESLTKKHLEFIAFIFGLLHGFGFSNLLKTIGLPQDDIPLTLFSFNLGIEIGQLIFIAVCLIFITLAKRYLKELYPSILKVLGYIIGGVASYWFFERIV
jgi:hydrogenase/urease accessory protein HupE